MKSIFYKFHASLKLEKKKHFSELFDQLRVIKNHF